MIKIDLIVGARPNFMKIAPIIHAIEKANKPNLDKPEPNRFLKVG